MGLIIGLTSQDAWEGYLHADVWPQPPQQVFNILLPLSFFTWSLGWGGAGEDTGSGTRGLAKVMRLGMQPVWGGKAGE